MPGTRLASIASTLAGSLLLSACVSAPLRQVSLSRVDPVLARAQEAPQPPPLRVAAAPVVSPGETLRSYGAMFQYVGKRLGRPIEVVQRRTYAETYELLRTGSVDLALVCTYVYVLGNQEFGLQPVAAPVANGAPEYRSLVIVRSDVGISGFQDLSGRRFAFTDPLSTTGRIYPLSVLRRLGSKQDEFFASYIYTHSHDNSIRAVLDGVVDGAAVDSLVYDLWVRRHPDRAHELRIVERSPTLPSPPFVARPSVSSHLVERFRTALLDMHHDPEGRRILTELGIDRFTVLADGAYDPVRDLAREAGVLP